MFYIGNFAKVKNELIGGRTYGGTYFNPSMKEFKVIIIQDIHHRLEEKVEYEFCGWCFTDEMLEPIEDEELSEYKTQARLLTDIYNVGKTGDIINAVALGKYLCLDTEYLPMLGILSANDAEKI